MTISFSLPDLLYAVHDGLSSLSMRTAYHPEKRLAWIIHKKIAMFLQSLFYERQTWFLEKNPLESFTLRLASAAISTRSSSRLGKTLFTTPFQMTIVHVL
jgi:hypothetical protein